MSRRCSNTPSPCRNANSNSIPDKAFSFPSQAVVPGPLTTPPSFPDVCLEENRIPLGLNDRNNAYSSALNDNYTNRAVCASTPLPLIPPKAPSLKDKITVVLDLDETLVYARAGPLYVRPGIEALLAFLRDNCETIVWTASMHCYADAVVAEIDKHSAVSHTISRSSSWLPHGKKDVKLLNRDLDRVILIDNTPDAIRGNEQNSLLVEDYEGGELEDTTLYTLVSFLKNLTDRIREDPSMTVPKYIKESPRVLYRCLPTDSGEYMECPCLAPDYAMSAASFPLFLSA